MSLTLATCDNDNVRNFVADAEARVLALYRMKPTLGDEKRAYEYMRKLRDVAEKRMETEIAELREELGIVEVGGNKNSIREDDKKRFEVLENSEHSKGAGLIATDAIGKFELVLSEKPVLTHNACEELTHEVCEKWLKSLSEEERAKVFRLKKCANDQIQKELEVRQMQKVQRSSKVIHKMKGTDLSKEDAERADLKMEENKASEDNVELKTDERDHAMDAMAVVRTNSLKTFDGFRVLYPTVSLLNHSCSPNCWFADGRFYALRDIIAGEELTWCYPQGKVSTSRYFLFCDRKDRKEFLNESYEFECKCISCEQGLRSKRQTVTENGGDEKLALVENIKNIKSDNAKRKELQDVYLPFAKLIDQVSEEGLDLGKLGQIYSELIGLCESLQKKMSSDGLGCWSLLAQIATARAEYNSFRLFAINANDAFDSDSFDCLLQSTSSALKQAALAYGVRGIRQKDAERGVETMAGTLHDRQVDLYFGQALRLFVERARKMK